MPEHGHAELMRGMLWGTLVLIAALIAIVAVGLAVFRREERARGSNAPRQS